MSEGGWTTCCDHMVDYHTLEGCPVCTLVAERDRLLNAINLAMSFGVFRRDEGDREFQVPMRCYNALYAAANPSEPHKPE